MLDRPEKLETALDYGRHDMRKSSTSNVDGRSATLDASVRIEKHEEYVAVQKPPAL